MKYLARARRLYQINAILIRYHLDKMVLTPSWLFPLRCLNYLTAWRYATTRRLARGLRIRLALEELGPIFIKAGQILSTRRDIIPDDIADELAKLQDRVPPFSGQLAKAIVAEALGLPLDSIFSHFEENSLASASIAQVHAATLLNGQSVIVKVLRPDIRRQILRDIDLLTIFAHIADRYWTASRSFKPLEMVAEAQQTLFDELDLLREGANATQLRRNFAESDALYVPEIFWSYCRSNVLVMERISGISIHNIYALQKAHYNLQRLAEIGIELFFTQVFRDSFFHADMHPGNIFVAHDSPEEPQYILVDFGIMGSLSTRDQRYLADNMLAFIKRDYQRVAELHITSGWVPPDTRVDQLAGAIRAVCEPIFSRPLKDISFGQLLMRLLQTAQRFNFNIQPQLLLLQKTLLNIEGIGRELYPDLNLWVTASPILEKWLHRQMGVKAFLRRVREHLPYWSEKIPEIPGLLYHTLQEKRIQQEEQRFAKSLAPFTTPAISSKQNKRFFFWGVSFSLLTTAIACAIAQVLPHALLYLLTSIGIISGLLGGITK